MKLNIASESTRIHYRTKILKNTEFKQKYVANTEPKLKRLCIQSRGVNTERVGRTENIQKASVIVVSYKCNTVTDSVPLMIVGQMCTHPECLRFSIKIYESRTESPMTKNPRT